MEGDTDLKITFLLNISDIMTEFTYPQDATEVKEALDVMKNPSVYRIMNILDKEGKKTITELKENNASKHLERMLEVGIIDNLGLENPVYCLSPFGKDMFKDYDPQKKSFRHQDIPCV